MTNVKKREIIEFFTERDMAHLYEIEVDYDEVILVFNDNKHEFRIKHEADRPRRNKYSVKYNNEGRSALVLDLPEMLLHIAKIIKY